MSLDVGLVVEANFASSGKWIRGEISHINSTNEGPTTFDIVFDGGDQELGVPMSRIRVPTNIGPASTGSGATAHECDEKPLQAPSEFVQIPTIAAFVGFALVISAFSVLVTGVRLSISALCFGDDITEAAWQEGKDGAAPSRLVGVALLLMFVRLLQQSSTELHRATLTSAGYRKNKIVTTGPYAWSRNPFYVASIGCMLALTLVFDTLWLAIWSVPLILHVVFKAVPEEEALLSQRWPTVFEVYQASTPRWLKVPIIWQHSTAVRSLSPSQKARFIK